LFVSVVPSKTVFGCVLNVSQQFFGQSVQLLGDEKQPGKEKQGSPKLFGAGDHDLITNFLKIKAMHGMDAEPFAFPDHLPGNLTFDYPGSDFDG
jgi:hypothetical protein